jgi:leader peptidase (prepilin peptidase)/N-methyltransferase
MDIYHFLVFASFALGLGCCIASFLNVCIWRLPRNESVVWPPSHCPKCNARIRWYQNIPVLSWLALRGRCANCHEPISVRYTVVELLGGILFLLAYFQWASDFFLRMSPPLGLHQFSNVWVVPVYWLVFSGLILGSFIDLEHYYLPDRVTIGGMLLGVPISYFVPELQRETQGLMALYWSLGGLAAGFFGLWSLGWLATKVFKKDAMGFGDVKLLGAIGAFFGPVAVLFTVIVSSFVGALTGGVLILRGKAKLGGMTAVPYGPFLALGVMTWMFWGPRIVKWYLQLHAFTK